MSALRGPDYTERVEYITPDGVTYRFSPPTFVLTEDGFGMPPLEYITERGPFQHGETVKDIFAKPRVVQLLIRRNGCSRAEYNRIRDELLDMLRPWRGNIIPPTPGKLRKYRADGSQRELLVYTSEGPSFPSHSPDQWDQWSIQDTIRFTAYDPIARDPTKSRLVVHATGSLGTFPITFPLIFGSFGVGTPIAVLDGTFDTYPVITFSGPLTGPYIKNLETGEVLAFSFSLSDGQVATVDLNYGAKTAIRDDGLNLLSYLTSDSSLATWHLQPGSNRLQVSATGTSAISSITLEWYKRYVGF